MNSFFDKLNLQPQEKRMVVIIAFVFFVVLNMLLVWPQFKEWSVVKAQLAQAEQNLAKFRKETEKIPGYQAKEKTLQGSGSDVLSEELQLQRIVQTQASASGVMINRYDPKARGIGGRTNQFFEDQVLNVDYNAGGKELVDFLVGMAMGNSMIRVRELNVKPDSSGTKLAGSISLVASYQKKIAVAKPPAAMMQPAAAAKPTAKTNTPSTAAPAPGAMAKATNSVAGLKKEPLKTQPAKTQQTNNPAGKK